MRSAINVLVLALALIVIIISTFHLVSVVNGKQRENEENSICEEEDTNDDT
jgi:hypothetical protein